MSGVLLSQVHDADVRAQGDKVERRLLLLQEVPRSLLSERLAAVVAGD